MTATRWQSWHAAFEEAGKAEHSLGAPHGRLILPLTGNDFAAALGEVMTTRVILMSPEQHQQACRIGSLTWYDARGRCVVIHRESGLAGAPEARPPDPYEQRCDAAHAALGYGPSKVTPPACGQKPNPTAGDAWLCPLPAGHYPATKHADYAGVPWPDGIFEPLKDFLARADQHPPDEITRRRVERDHAAMMLGSPRGKKK